jgi:predicted AAA+ superfamily ATPase
MSLKMTISRVLTERGADRLPRPVPRAVEVMELSGKASALVGMRRAGKTWRMFQDIGERLDEGVPPGRLLYIDFEDDRLMGLSAESLHLVDEAHRALHPDHADRALFVYLDEVQNVPGWERYVRRLLHSGHRVWVTGSSARLLSREVATSLRGRALTTEVFPLSLAEAGARVGLRAGEMPDEADRARAEALTHAYLRVGGFPEVQGVDDVVRPAVLQSYVDVVVLRDVMERHDVGNVAALRYLVGRCLSDPGSRMSVHKLYNDLRSQGVRAGKNLLHDLLQHLEDAYLIGTVHLDTPSAARRASNPRKIYPVDPGLAAAHSIKASANHGHLLETVVYWELRRRGYEVAYGLTRSSFEVDFVARRRGRGEGVLLVQVAWRLDDPSTRARELRALDEAMAEHQTERALLITAVEHGEESVESGQVTLLPFAWWAMRWPVL